MKLNDLPFFLEIDVSGSLKERFMDSDVLYTRFLKKLLVDTNVAELKQAVVLEDWDTVLRKAHNLKGVCANLGLTKLSSNFAAIVSELRSGSYKVQRVQHLLDEALAEWDKTIACISKLE